MRSVCRADAAHFLPGFGDDAFMRFMTRGAFASEDELAEWLLDTDWGGRTWIAQPLGGGAPVCRMIARADTPGVCEIGYFTVPGLQRQGIARECVAALIDHLFRAEKHHRIWADIDPENRASNGLVERLGFTREAHLRDAIETHIGWRDAYIWGLLASEWSAAQSQ